MSENQSRGLRLWSPRLVGASSRPSSARSVSRPPPAKKASSPRRSMTKRPVISPASRLPGDPSQLQPVELHDRNTWGTALSAEALAYPTATDQERVLYDFESTGFSPALLCQSAYGRRGCRTAVQSAYVPGLSQQLGREPRQPRQGRDRLGARQHQHRQHARLARRPQGQHEPRQDHQGSTATRRRRPSRSTATTHPRAVSSSRSPSSAGRSSTCRRSASARSTTVPSLSQDPYLQGGIDPVTRMSTLGLRRAKGERAAPPYVARGLMEAIHYMDLLANEDHDDHIRYNSSLAAPARPAHLPRRLHLRSSQREPRVRQLHRRRHRHPRGSLRPSRRRHDAAAVRRRRHAGRDRAHEPVRADGAVERGQPQHDVRQRRGSGDHRRRRSSVSAT